MKNNHFQLSSILDHQDLAATKQAIIELLAKNYGPDVNELVPRIFDRTLQLFNGHMPGYQACNTDYHNLAHTIDVFVATIRLIDGHRLAGLALSAQEATDLGVAALLHDVGYIQDSNDREGSGGKYTKTHVRRGVEFLERHHADWNIPAERVPTISRLILGTDLALAWDSLGFVDAAEQTRAAILATADLLGQMADRAYLEKLLFLYYEFREAGFDNYKSAFDILKSTQSSYGVIQKRLDTILEKAYEKAIVHFRARFDTNHNLYMESISHQMAYLKEIMDDDSSNFRQKLKRLDLEIAEKRQTA